MSKQIINHVCESSHLLKMAYMPERMTSNTTPKGRCFASSAGRWYTWDPINEPFYAFNKSEVGQWVTVSGDTIGAFIGYEFEVPTTVKRINVRQLISWTGVNYSGLCKEFILQGSNDGNTWIDIETFTFNKIKIGYRQSFILNNAVKYLIYRIYITKLINPQSGYPINFTGLSNIEFFSKSEYTEKDMADHNDIMYIWNDGGQQHMDFFSKMYLENDTCNGLIWEKTHPTDEFIMTFGDSNAWLIYPQEGYVSSWSFINRNDKTRTLTEDLSRGGISKDYLIRVNRDNIGVTKNGKEWVITEIPEFREIQDYRYKSLTVNPNNNTGIIRFFYASKIYGFSIESSGHATIKEIHLPNDVSITTEIGGYIFFTYPNARPSDPIYRLDSNGGIQASCLQVPSSQDWITGYYIMNRKLFCMSKIKAGNPPAWEIQIAESNDGFLTKRIYSFENFPHYGEPNWGYQIPYFFDNSYRMIVPREGLFDIWDYGSSFGNSPTIHYSLSNTKKVKMIGWHSSPYWSTIVDENGCITVEARAADPYWTINNPSYYQKPVVYFKNGKIVEPYNAIVNVSGYAPYNNLSANLVISGDLFNSGNFESFMFEAGVYRSNHLVFDKNNISWKL